MSDYTGRHRPLTRTERRAAERRPRLPRSLTPTYALPTAAAVTLALTAAGATAAQSSPFGGEAASQAQTAFTAPGGGSDTGAAALLDDPGLTDSARAEVDAAADDSTGLTQRRQDASTSVAEGQGRTQERQRAARDEARKELAAEKRAERERAWEERKAAWEEQKAASAEQASADGPGSSSDSGNPSGAEWVSPIDNGSLSSGFGPRGGRMHNGVDYAAPIGTPLKAMGEGTVVAAGPMSGYGTYIDIEYGDGTVSRYGHLDSVSASVGQQVSAGDVVAQSGNTGRSTGPHLHLEIRPGGGEPIDPAGWLSERGIG